MQFSQRKIKTFSFSRSSDHKMKTHLSVTATREQPFCTGALASACVGDGGMDTAMSRDLTLRGEKNKLKIRFTAARADCAGMERGGRKKSSPQV